MNPAGSELTSLERAVLEKFLTGNHPALAILRQQLPAVTVVDRKFTGAGCFTKFSVPHPLPARLRNSLIRLTDVNAQIDGVRNGAGFVLYIENGIIDCLEGFTYGDDEWPKDDRPFRLEYDKPDRRDLSALV